MAPAGFRMRGEPRSPAHAAAAIPAAVA